MTTGQCLWPKNFIFNFIFDPFQLSKFTNVVKGWQYRWFVLEPEAGRLEYHLLEDRLVRSWILLIEILMNNGDLLGMVGAEAVNN